MLSEVIWVVFLRLGFIKMYFMYLNFFFSISEGILCFLVFFLLVYLSEGLWVREGDCNLVENVWLILEMVIF